MLWKKNIKLIHARIDFIVEQSKNMAKQIDKISQALENTVYPGMNEERKAIENNMNAINKIIAKIYKKKEVNNVSNNKTNKNDRKIPNNRNTK